MNLLLKIDTSPAAEGSQSLKPGMDFEELWLALHPDDSGFRVQGVFTERRTTKGERS